MKQNRIKTKMIVAKAIVVLFTISCSGQQTKQISEMKTEAIFPKGQLGPAENFTGKAWNIGLVANDSMYNTVVGNVYFEPAARSNWHIHPSGQILVITDGVGFHQIKGKPKQTIRKGDVIKCPPNLEHWHGQGLIPDYNKCTSCQKQKKALFNGCNR